MHSFKNKNKGEGEGGKEIGKVMLICNLHHPDLSDGRTDKMYGPHDEKLVSLKLKYDPANVFNKWGDVTAEAVEQNHGYNTINLKPKQIAVE